MFSKAKIIRFNETAGCAPPPTKYNVNVTPKIKAVIFDKSDRFIEDKENTPGPNAYLALNLKPIETPKKKVGSVPKFNLSICSSSSASSNTGFLSPAPFIRSRSLRTSKNKNVVKKSDFERQIEELIIERDSLQVKIADYEKKFKSEDEVLCGSSTAINEIMDDQVSDVAENETTESSKATSININSDEYQLMKDELEHLTLLRDNLEKSISRKDDIIADLNNQVYHLIDEAREFKNDYSLCKEEIDKLNSQLKPTTEEDTFAECQTAQLVSRYQSIIQHYSIMKRNLIDDIARRDVNIELLNDSISVLTTKVSEYNNQLSVIPNLESRIGDLLLESKEKEVIGTMLQSELDEKYTQVKILEESLSDVEKKVNEVQKEKDELKQLTEEFSVEIEQLHLQAKERDVLQQFLEKEISSRESEINEYGIRMHSLEGDFESVQQLAIDLQEDAESQVNKLFCLQASLSAKEYDIEAKDDVIEELKEQISKSCREKCSDSKDANVLLLEEELRAARDLLQGSIENASQLEDKIIQLLAEIGEREEMHNKRILEKDSELEELSVKYSDALLEQDGIKRLLNHTSEELDKNKMLILTTDMELNLVKSEFKKKVEQNKKLEKSALEMAFKLTHLEDALACEEAESQNMQDELQDTINSTEECLSITKKELESVTASYNGFMSQITQLRIGMQKKCCAVDEMQGCIDALRQEKSELNTSYKEMKHSFNDKETLLTDLEKEFEGKLKAITELRDIVSEKNGEIMTQNGQIKSLSKQVENLHLEGQETEMLLNSRMEEASLQWIQEQNRRIALEVKAQEIQDDLNTLQEDKDKVINDMLSTLSERDVKISELQSSLSEIEAKYEGYDDQINNLQISLTEKINEVDRFETGHNQINLAVECQQENSFQLKNQLQKLEEDHSLLQQSIQLKDQMVSDMNYSMLLKSDELHELRKEIDLKQMKITSLEESLDIVRQQLSTSVLELESGHGKILEIGDILQKKLHNETSLKKEMECLSEELENLRIDQNLKQKEIQQKSDNIEMAVNFWKNKFKYLEKMIEPFKEQLSAYDLDRAILLSESSAAQNEVNKLSREYATLLGHTNHKQKIQHVVKLKEENNQLKKEVLKMHHDIDNLRQAHRKLEEQTGARQKTNFLGSKRENKENAGPSAQDVNPVLSPLRASHKVNRI